MKETLQFACYTADVGGSNVQILKFPRIGRFSPKGIRIRVSNQTVNGGFGGLPVASSRIGVGYGDTNLVQRAYSSFSHDAETSKPSAGCRYDNATIIQTCGLNSTGLEAEAVLVGYVPGGVQLRWDDYPADPVLFEATAYYGNVQCDLHDVTPSASINGTVTKTGLPFAPNALEFLTTLNAFAADSTATSARVFWGASVLQADGTTIKNLAFGTFDRNLPTATGNSFQSSAIRDDCSIQQHSTNAGGTTSTSARVEVTSYTSDGYVLTTRDVAASIPVAVFAIRYGNGDRWCGIPTLVNSTTGVKSITTPGFKPLHLDAVGTRLTAKNVVTTSTESTSYSLGSGIPSAQYDASWQGLDGLWFPTPGFTIQKSSSDAKAIQVYDDALGVLYSCLIDAFTSSGWDVNVDVENLSTDRMTGWVEIGGAYPVLVESRGGSRSSASTARIRVGTSKTNGIGRGRAVGSASKTAAPKSRGQALSRAVPSRQRTATSSSRGQARVVVIPSRLRTAVARSNGAARVIVVPSRQRTAVARSNGAARVIVVSSAQKTARVSSRGASRARAVATVLKSVLASSRGAALVKAAPSVARSARARTDGRAMSRAVPTAAKSARSRAAGAATSVGRVGAIKTALARSFGAAMVVGRGTAAGAVTASARGAARARAVGSKLAAALAQSRGTARSAGATARVRGTAGRALGGSRAVATIGINVVLASGSSRGAARASAAAVRVRVAVARSRGTALATSTVVRTRRAVALAASVARALAAGAKTAGATARSAGAALLRAAPSRTRAATGWSAGSSRAASSLGEARRSGYSRGSSRARAYGARAVSGCDAIDTALDERILPRALDVVARLGREVVIRTVASRSYSRATGAVTRVGEVSRTVTASPILSYVDRYGDMDTTRVGESQLIVPAKDLGFVPAIADLVEADGGVWTVLTVSPVRSGARVAVYVLGLEGAKLPRLAATSDRNALDLRLPGVSRRLVQKYGKNFTFLVPSARIRNAGAGSVTDLGVDEYCEKVVTDQDSAELLAGESSGLESVVGYLRGDLPFDPFKSMEATADGQTWTVTECDPVYVGGRIALWKLVLSR